MLSGEAIRTLDARYRLSLPAEMAEAIGGGANECLIAKERPGCLSLWRRDTWEERQRQSARIVEDKLASGRLDRRLRDVQRLGRLLSTRQRIIPLAGRGRLVIPEGFRELLNAEPGQDIVLVGAAVCIELWHPDAWAQMVGDEMPTFRELLDDLVG
ncbi:MAG: division/cell wall cluster transcriptional repressor MraZ [Planctomycetota bacterium]